MAPKPAGGERILGMLPTIPKTWSKLRASITDQWSRSLGEFWDTAIKGSSALRAALMRALLDESAAAFGISHATLLMDVEKFYDSVNFAKLFDTAILAKFPPIVVALELQLFLSPRYLRMHGWVSDIIDPQRSIVAGSAHGGKLAKVYPGPILAKAHANYTYAGL